MTVTTCPNPREIVAFLPSVRPTWFFAVPRIFEKLKAGLEGYLSTQGEQTVGWVAAARRKVELEQAGEPVPDDVAATALRAASGDATVGISLNLALVRPASDADADAARIRDGHLNRWFLDPLLRAEYPADILALYEQRVGRLEVEPGDLATIAEPLDFLGVNYYHPERVRADPASEPLGVAQVGGRNADAEALSELLARLEREYDAPPIWITENGLPDGPGDPIEDDERIAYLQAHLAALTPAVRRYHVWSLLDNFEWELGYAVRFGLVHVDYETQRRVPKLSARWYRDHIAHARSRRDG